MLGQWMLMKLMASAKNCWMESLDTPVVVAVAVAVERAVVEASLLL